MKNSNEIKARIKSIRETSHITKAMQMISVAKMRKALEKYEENKAYNALLKKSIADIFTRNEDAANPYLAKRQGNRVAYIVIAGDKGFAGDYNHKVLSLAYSEIQSAEEKRIFAVGHMSYDFFTARGIETDTEFLDATNSPSAADAEKVMRKTLELYNAGEIDELKIVYTRVISASSHEAVAETLLPLSKVPSGAEETAGTEKRELPEFNGDYKGIIEIIVKQYILGMVYGALVQSVVVEHYERMVSMDNATRNSKKMLDKLNLDFNKLRQEKITTEICESSVFLMKKD